MQIFMHVNVNIYGKFKIHKNLSQWTWYANRYKISKINTYYLKDKTDLYFYDHIY